MRRVRSGAAPAAKTALLRMGGYSALRRCLPSRGVAILRYHAICGEDGYSYADPEICVSPQAFEQHAAYLAANYSVLPLPEVVDRLRAGRPLPQNCVAITFDDGYADNLAAARVLHRHGLTATFYLTAGCLADGEPFWPAELRALVPLVREPLLRLAAAGHAVDVPLGTETDRRQAIRSLTRLFKSNPIPVRESLRAQLRRAAGDPHVAGPMLTWSDVAEMQRIGMTIGAHTVTHPNLPSAGLDAAAAEVKGSRLQLEAATGAPVSMFSYPNGGAERYYTPELQRLVADSGFAAAASSRNGFAGAKSDLYALERIEVQERLEDLVFALEVERFVLAPRNGAAQ